MENEFKGTPGPWILDGGQNQTGENTNVILSPSKSPITDDVYNDYDAFLIASAPDLLEALQEVMNVYEKHGSLLNFDVNITRAAINKALNQSPS